MENERQTDNRSSTKGVGERKRKERRKAGGAGESNTVRVTPGTITGVNIQVPLVVYVRLRYDGDGACALPPSH